MTTALLLMVISFGCVALAWCLIYLAEKDSPQRMIRHNRDSPYRTEVTQVDPDDFGQFMEMMDASWGKED